MTGAPHKAHAVVIGAGIGGLAASLALAQRGWRLTLLERRADPGETGAGIQLGPNATRLLAGLGVRAVAETRAATPEAIVVGLARSGRRLARLPVGAWIAGRQGAPYLTMHRQDLHASLLAAVVREPLIDIRTGVEASRIHEADTAVRVEDQGGGRHDGALAVVADGLWSRHRGTFGGGPRVVPVGHSAWRTVIETRALPAEIDPANVGVWLAPRLHVVHYPVRRGQETALVVVAEGNRDAAAEWDVAAPVSGLESRLADAWAPLKDLLIGASGWRRWALHEAEEIGPMANGRIALLGDAAHPILPYLAQGAAMALEDAVVLADRLAAADLHVSEARIAEALAAYDRARRPRVARVAGEARRNGGLYHLAGLPAQVRNLALRAAPPRLMMRRYDWLYGWRGKS